VRKSIELRKVRGEKVGLKFVDIFAGMGGFRMGMEQAGHECVYSIEWDKHKRKIYSVIFGEEPEGGDIRDVQANELPRADVWCFGFPCQDISVAGKQKGFDGERSSLFFEVMRLLQETQEENRPKHLFIENVKNLFSVNRGLDFLEVLYCLDKVGYDAEWQLLNSKNFGVPQNRERVFIVGHLRGRSTKKIFPISGSTVSTLEQIVPGSDAQRVYSTSCARTLKAEGGGQGAKTGLYIVSKEGQLKTSNTKGQYASCLTGGGHSGGNHSDMDLLVQAVLTPDRAEKRQNGRRMKEPDEPMFTLTGQDRHGVAIYDLYNKNRKIDGVCGTLTANGNTSTTKCGTFGVQDGVRIRRLTPKECMRLQGVSDEVTDKLIAVGISDTQLYRGAGDGVTVNVIYEIAKKL